MPIYLKKEDKEKIFSEFGGSDKNTGSTEGQVALFTARIQGLTAHLHENKKDHSARTRLLSLVGQRKKMLKYLAKKDIQKYRDLIEKLGIRK